MAPSINFNVFYIYVCIHSLIKKIGFKLFNNIYCKHWLCYAAEKVTPLSIDSRDKGSLCSSLIPNCSIYVIMFLLKSESYKVIAASHNNDFSVGCTPSSSTSPFMNSFTSPRHSPNMRRAYNTRGNSLTSTQQSTLSYCRSLGYCLLLLLCAMDLE